MPLDPDELRRAYTKKSKKLKQQEEKVSQEKNEFLKSSMRRLQKDLPLLPEELKLRVLELRLAAKLPVTLFPEEYFKKPGLRGRRAYFQRLGSEILSFGVSFQRAFGRPPSDLKELTDRFLETNGDLWTGLGVKDIEIAIDILFKGKVISRDASSIFFEPIGFSEDVIKLLDFVRRKGSKQNFFSIDELKQRLLWEEQRVHSVIKKLLSESVIREDSTSNIFWIPALE